tara:strand:- start:1135 stop:2058 length:924 start_codon:yes stop_codon:yes gene_type:complete
MINKSYNYLILTLLLWIMLSSIVLAKAKIEIIFKIEEHIITNIDIENEIKFLIFLNPSLEGLNKNQIKQISKNSLKNRKIKEIELVKFIDLKKENIGDNFIENFLSNSKLSKDQLLDQLNKVDLPYEFFEYNFIVDNVWRQFVYNKFKSQVKINLEDLKKQITSQNTKIEELNLSEILFENKLNKNFNDLKSKIYSEIKKSGFEAAASIYSISESKNFGGNLGWIKSNQISKEIYDQINSGKKITNPIKTNNGFLIIKVNDRREINQEINFDEELKKIINIETEKQLNKLGYIYFNKIKKRIFISEK